MTTKSFAILALALAFALVACGSSDDNAQEAAPLDNFELEDRISSTSAAMAPEVAQATGAPAMGGAAALMATPIAQSLSVSCDAGRDAV